MLGYVFLPYHWVELVSNETIQLLSYSQIVDFLHPLQEDQFIHLESLYHDVNYIILCNASYKDEMSVSLTPFALQNIY